MLRTFVGNATRSKRSTLGDNLSGQASASRHPLPLILGSTPVHSYSTWSSLRKGKHREENLGQNNANLANERRQLSPRQLTLRIQHRSFHSTRPRLAVPLIPAGFAILKSASVLTVVTHVARILISFFPIGTIAALKFRSGAKWLADAEPPPETTDEAKEFFLMWCREDKGIRVTQKEALQLVNAKSTEDDGLRLPDGRTAYCTLGPPNRYTRDVSGDDRRHVRFLRTAYYFLPPLPSASVRSYNEFSNEERRAILGLRRHWVSTRMFKERLHAARVVFVLIFGLPIMLILGVYISALERTPLTGRWRLILLTPEEEDHISKALSGQNWYKSVINLLTTSDHPAPVVLPLEDWRWQWVTSTLRRLEEVVIEEADRGGHDQHPPRTRAQRPPSTEYPIKPRPRVSSMLHSALPGSDRSSGQEHLELGPPYSLLLMEKNERNAFSYGFGGKGAGGIVVYTGLLDDILRDGVQLEHLEKPNGFWSGLFGSNPRPRPRPTEQQTLHLASVLAHEMGHLLLSHHLEMLSQQQVLFPSVLGLALDLTRAFIWPLTFFLGPTVNDALANVGKTSVTELADRFGEIGFQWIHEYEADFAGVRLLSLAGYDPHAAMAHFADSVADLREIQPLDKTESDSVTSRLFKLWTETTHPSAEQRVAAIKDELKKWDAAAASPQIKNIGP